MSDGKTEIAVGDENGSVVLRFPKAIEWARLDPQNAFEIGEAIARAAHRARFGEEPPSDSSYIGQQIKSRVTDQIRDKLVIRTALLLKNMQNSNKTPGYWALQIVDTLLSEVG